ncbi:MAG TPA: TolC family protein [Minicystis sp.]|nr:TolC family protein [Minicystis sp.]
MRVPSKWLSIASLIVVSAEAAPAWALQPLAQFVAAAEAQSVDAAEARATATQRSEEEKQAWAKLAPSVSAHADMTHNQFVPPFPITFQNPATGKSETQLVTVTPENQLDASVALNVPIVDVGSWLRIGAAGATSAAARVRADATGLDLARSVSRTYYQIVAADASIDAAKRAVAASEQNAKVVADRLSAGTASDLDVQRARAEVERARQTLAAAEGSYATSKRALETATGVRPEDGAMPTLEDALTEEAPLAALEPGAARLPAVRAAQLEAKAAARNAQAAWAALAPTISGTASERVSCGYDKRGCEPIGFVNTAATYQLVLQANWNLDATTYFGAKAQDAAHAAATARVRRAELAAHDDLFNAWQQVRTQIATARAAKAQLDASRKAAALVRERYAVGSATQLEVTQADRDALEAEMSVIQAYADLAYARELVRIDSGRPTSGARR